MITLKFTGKFVTDTITRDTGSAEDTLGRLTIQPRRVTRQDMKCNRAISNLDFFALVQV